MYQSLYHSMKTLLRESEDFDWSNEVDPEEESRHKENFYQLNKLAPSPKVMAKILKGADIRDVAPQIHPEGILNFQAPEPKNRKHVKGINPSLWNGFQHIYNSKLVSPETLHYLLSKDPNWLKDKLNSASSVMHVLQHPNLSPETLSYLENIAYDPKDMMNDNTFILDRVASHPNTPPDQLSNLYASGHDEVLTALAGNPKLPLPLLHDLYKSSNYHYALARNPALPAHLQQRLTQSTDLYPLRILLKNPNLDRIALDNLVKHDRNMALHPELLQRPELSANQLEHIARNHDPELKSIAKAIIEHPNADEKALTALATSPSSDIRKMIAKHPNTPTDVLSKLASDIFKSVAQTARNHPNYQNISKTEA